MCTCMCVSTAQSKSSKQKTASSQLQLHFQQHSEKFILISLSCILHAKSIFHFYIIMVVMICNSYYDKCKKLVEYKIGNIIVRFLSLDLYDALSRNTDLANLQCNQNQNFFQSATFSGNTKHRNFPQVRLYLLNFG